MNGPTVSLALCGLLIAAVPGTPQVAASAPGAAPTTQQPQPPVHERALRARAHLEALLSGRLSTADLSPQDLQDVIDLDRIVRGVGADNRSTRERCVEDEVRRNGGSPSRLAWQVIRMKCR